MATSGTLSAPLMSSSAVGTRGEVEPLLERDLAAEPATSSDTPLTPWSAFLNNVTNGISNLANLLPTGTFLAFTTIAPIITDNGTCDQPSELWLSVAATIFFAAFCFFSCFTDSFVASDGKVYLGVVTFFGLWTPQLPTGLQPTDQGAYRLKFSDIVYAFLSLAVFTACALMTPNIRSCLFPELSATVVQTVPAVVSFVVSAVFTLFPSKRHGIGFPVSPISSSSSSSSSQGTTTI